MCILKINKLNFDFKWTNTSINVFKIILWWFGSVLKCIPISTPPPPIRAHLPHSLPVSQQMLIGVTRLHSQLYCISLIICAGMTHIHTHTHTLAQGFPCCLGDEMPAFLSAKDSVGSVCVFVCWWIRGCTGVGSRRVPGFPPNESGRQSAPRSAHSPQGYLGNSDRGLPSSAPLCSTIISLSLLEQ